MEQAEENSSLVCIINDNKHSNNTTLDSGEIQPGCIHPHGVPLLEDMGYNDEIGDDSNIVRKNDFNDFSSNAIMMMTLLKTKR